MFFIIFGILDGSSGQFPTTEPELIVQHVAGLSTNVEITCGFDRNVGPSLWVINGSIYDIFQDRLLFLEVDTLFSIKIPTVNICLNNITFQCLSATLHSPGRVTRMLVVESKFTL